MLTFLKGIHIEVRLNLTSSFFSLTKNRYIHNILIQKVNYIILFFFLTQQKKTWDILTTVKLVFFRKRILFNDLNVCITVLNLFILKLATATNSRKLPPPKIQINKIRNNFDASQNPFNVTHLSGKFKLPNGFLMFVYQLSSVNILKTAHSLYVLQCAIQQ